MTKSKIRILGYLLVFIFTGSQFYGAADGQKDSRFKMFPSVMYAPSVIPDRVVLTLVGDPRTTQAVTWRTSTAVKKGIAEIAVAESGPNFPKESEAVCR